MDNLKDLIAPILSCVQEVGFYIEDIKKQNRFENRPKDLADFADVQAHKLLSNLLKKNIDISVVSEEDPISHNIDEECYWLIDPIDGTSSYSNKYSGYVVQCSLMKNNKPVLSAIYAPSFKKSYYAYEGGGAWMNGVSLIRDISDDNYMRSLIDNEPTPHDIAAVVYEKLDFRKYIECGSLGLKMCLVAERIASAFVKSTIVRDWDVAPASLLLKEANCYFTDSYSNSIFFKSGLRSHIGLIVTSNELLHNNITKVIARERKNGNFT